MAKKGLPSVKHSTLFCDLVSAFIDEDERSAWYAWNEVTEVTKVFLHSNIPIDNLTSDENAIIEVFVSTMIPASLIK